MRPNTVRGHHRGPRVPRAEDRGRIASLASAASRIDAAAYGAAPRRPVSSMPIASGVSRICRSRAPAPGCRAAARARSRRGPPPQRELQVASDDAPRRQCCGPSSPHGVDGYAHAAADAATVDGRRGGVRRATCEGLVLGLFNRTELPALVVTAVRAHLVRFDSRHCGHAPTGTGCRASCVRRLAPVRVLDAAFWIRHESVLLLSVQQPLERRKARIVHAGLQSQVVRFKFAPHWGHRPCRQRELKLLAQ